MAFEVGAITGSIKLATDAFERGIKNATNAVDKLSTRIKRNATSFRQAGLAMAAVSGAIVLAIKKTTDAYAEQERAEKRLMAAMKQAGTFSEGAIKSQLEYASALQATTRYSDEAIVSVQELLARRGAEGEILKRLTKATLDFASAQGMDLRSAAEIMSKTIGSSINALSRYGITVEGAAGSNERMLNTIDAVSKVFGGAASADAMTYSGRIEQLKNQIDDVAEKIGVLFIPALTNLAVSVSNIVGKISDFIDRNKAWADLLARTALVVGGLAGAFAPLLLTLPTIANTITGFVIPAIKSLWALISAHPLAAATVAAIGLIEAIHKLGSAYYDNKNQGEALLKTKKDLIKAHKAELESLRGTTSEAGAIRAKQLANAIVFLEREIKAEEAAAKKKEELRLKEIRDREQLLNEIAMMEEQRIADEEEYQEALAEMAAYYSQQELEDWRKALEEKFQLAATMFGQLSKTAQSYFDLQNININVDRDRALDVARKKYEAQKEYIEQNVTDEQERIKQLGELEKSYQAERENIEADARQKERAAKQAMKPFMIAEAIANTALAVTKALTAAIPPFNFILAGLVATQGALQVATISAQQFETGGVMTHSGMAIVGEKGAELVELPAGARVHNADDTQRMLSPITINVQVLDPEALSESVWERIARKVTEQQRFAFAR